MNDKDVIIFIPTYNDSVELCRLIDEITENFPAASILVIDDGSELPIKTYRKVLKVRIPFNMGLGVATHVAIDYALYYNFNTLIRVDADGQHSIDDISQFLSALNESNDVVIGTRENRNEFAGLSSFFKRFARAYIYLLVKLTVRKKIPSDINSGFIAMNKKVMQYINTIELDRYPEPQIILHSVSAGLTVGEVKIQQNERKFGMSTIKLSSGLRLLFRVSIYCVVILFQMKKT